MADRGPRPGAFEGGTPQRPDAEEIGEALLQVAIYCGIPAGIDSTCIAREAFAELDMEERPLPDRADR